MKCTGCKQEIKAFGCLQCGEAFSVEQMREEGRREILREVAKLHVLLIDSSGGQHCQCCSGENEHKPTCLWLRAHQVTG